MPVRFNRGNQILGLMSDSDYAKLLPHLKPFEFEVPNVLYETNSQIEFAYFPLSGALSAVVVMEDGDMIEVGTIGNEGAVGCPTFGASDISVNRVFVQVRGSGLRVASPDLANLSVESESLRQLAGRYHAAFLFQVSRSVACNGLHPVHRRLARWLAMTRDRVGTDGLGLTHELLGIMLGVRRASVTEEVRALQGQGLIRAARGKIIVVDRAGLEKACCECYAAVENEYRRLLPRSPV